LSPILTEAPGKDTAQPAAGLLRLGYLTISNALQWRRQYGRVIVEAGLVDGITRIK
jgi:hypothetical protein